MPEVTLSLPAALGLLVLFLAVGATVVYAGLSATQRVVNPTAIPTTTETSPLLRLPPPTRSFPPWHPLPPNKRHLSTRWRPAILVEVLPSPSVSQCKASSS